MSKFLQNGLKNESDENSKNNKLTALVALINNFSIFQGSDTNLEKYCKITRFLALSCTVLRILGVFGKIFEK